MWFLKIFAQFIQNLYKDFEQKFFLGFVLGVLEGLINRGSFWFPIFTLSSVQCSPQALATGLFSKKMEIHFLYATKSLSSNLCKK